jgi:thymidylate synthase (FAD)
MQLIKDPRFQVVIDKDASSPNPQVAIWKGQHRCVAEKFLPGDSTPSPERCGEIIIKHQLAGDRGHYSVLRSAFVKFHCLGFPHSVVSQVTRHQDSAFLVQSMRYTGKRVVDCSDSNIPLEDVFYFRPAGSYSDRQGSKYDYTNADLLDDRAASYRSAILYSEKIQDGHSEEHARDFLTYNFRQDFDLSGDLQAIWHLLDQRTKADSQIEVRTLAWMMLDCLKEFTPELTQWYLENRAGKARLAP